MSNIGCKKAVLVLLFILQFLVFFYSPKYCQLKHQELTSRIIAICIRVHSELGPGLVESIYEEAVCYELQKHGLAFKRQEGIKVYYDNHVMGIGFRADIIVEDLVLIELKAREYIPPVYFKVIHTYLKFSKLEVGLMINFHVDKLKEGITRYVLDQNPKPAFK